VCGAQTIVEGQYIVVLKDTANGSARPPSVEATSAALVAQFGGERKHLYRTALKGYSARMTAAQAEALARDARVRYVQPDRFMRLSGTQASPPWGLDRIDQHPLQPDNTYTFDGTGKGVHVYVVDTGIRISHAEFGGRASQDYTAIDDGHGADDGQGHGTHVAGIIGGATYGVAKDVRLHAVRIFPWGERTSPKAGDFIAAIDWVTENHANPAVVNISASSECPDTATHEAVSNSIKTGLTYVVAAGNQNPPFSPLACDHSPADVAEAITVASSDSADAQAATSNFGQCVDLFAPGVNVLSAGIASDTATLTLSGTSMATPHVTGVVARYLERNPTATPATIRDDLLAIATSDVLANIEPPTPNQVLFAPRSFEPFRGSVSGIVHLQDIGDQPLVNGVWAGTKGQSRRLEGFALELPPTSWNLSIEAMCRVQGVGETSHVAARSYCGTRGQKRALEGLALKLIGSGAPGFDLYTQCHLSDVGDFGPVLNGELCGIAAASRRVEAINVWVARKTTTPIAGVAYFQNTGQRPFKNNEFVGTRGQGQLEAMELRFEPAVPGLQLEMMCHVQGVGNTHWLPAGELCATPGQARRLEGFALRLAGPRAADYDVTYLCHPRGQNDIGPVHNGDFCGTRGQSRPLEGLYVWVSPKL
jgi:hypothetical protein